MTGAKGPSVARCLADATTRINQTLRGVNGKLDSQILLGHVLDKPRTWLLAHDEETVPDAALAAFSELLTQRLRGNPIAYLIGYQEFWSLQFQVSDATLVPRPDTETLVTLAVQLSPPGARVLDMGTGCGNIAISITHERPDLEVIATDRQTSALRVAASNNQTLVGGKVKLVASHWLQAFARNSFDVIVSNPPYINVTDPHLGDLQSEPRTALVADDNGLADIAAIIHAAPDYLKAGGLLMLEHGYDQAPEVQALFSNRGFTNIRCEADLAGQPRVSLAVFPG